MSIKSVKPIDEVATNKGNDLYLKLGDKDNASREVKFVILSDPQIGYEWWQTNRDTSIDKKAIVHRNIDPVKLPAVEDPFEGPFGPSKVKEFMAMEVFDMNEDNSSEAVKILAFQQQTVISQFLDTEKDEDLGEVQDYMWKVKWNDATGTDRKYSVMRLNETKPTDEMRAAQLERKINLDKYMEGLNPLPEDTASENDKKGDKELDEF